jgi:hypothetical protein
MRDVTVDCDRCGARLSLEKAKEVLVKQGENAYHVLDVCPTCLDDLLQSAESVNDTNGYRQQAAALITPAAGADLAPQRRAS